MLNIPYYPISYFNNIPQYSVFDVELFGTPDIYGIKDFFVLDELVIDDKIVLKEEDYDKPSKRERPIHHYSREQRFKWTLRVLLGGSRDSIPLNVLTCFQRGDINWDPFKIWKSIRNALKLNGYVKYYNRIPEILRWHYYSHTIIIPKTINYEEMYTSFKKMHYNFSKITWEKRKYFPNLRYIVLRMLKERGVIFQYHIPLLHTKSKLPILNSVWEEINKERFIIKLSLKKK